MSRGLLTGLLCLALINTAARAEEQIVIVANSNVAESVELAKYYAEKRGIESSRICLLDLPAGEVIARRFYEDRLRGALLKFLRDGKFITQVRREASAVHEHDSGWKTVKSEVKYIALIHGVPLRIEDTRGALARKTAQLLSAPMARDDAAVDSELALALLDGYDIEGRVPNFFYEHFRWDDISSQNALLLVARLDGPDSRTVRRMIDDTLLAEKHGLWGRVYVDAQGLTDTSYLMGDRWLREAAARFERDGWWVVTDIAGPVWGTGFPMEQCAVYMGWYAEHCVGPFTRTNFAFARGAFAYHNHSANAKSLRTTTEFWCGPLLAKGACCTMGATAEPYLQFTPNMQTFADRWLMGATLAEAAYMALPALSWQTTVVGDPLYRPFSRAPLISSAAQATDAGDGEDWAFLQMINRLVLQGRFNIALDQLRGRLAKKDSTLLRERLADLYFLNEMLGDADREYRAVLDAAATPETAWRVAQKEVRLFRGLRRNNEAAKIVKQVREKWPGSSYEAPPEVEP